MNESRFIQLDDYVVRCFSFIASGLVAAKLSGYDRWAAAAAANQDVVMRERFTACGTEFLLFATRRFTWLVDE